MPLWVKLKNVSLAEFITLTFTIIGYLRFKMDKKNIEKISRQVLITEVT